MINPRLANWVVGIVTGVWVANFAIALIPGLDYKPDPAIHGVFMLIAGGALTLKRKSDNGDDGDS